MEIMLKDLDSFLLAEEKIVEVFPLEPLQSNEGWYVGSMCQVEITYDDGTTETMMQPYERQSHYMDTKDAALRYLSVIDPGEE